MKLRTILYTCTTAAILLFLLIPLPSSTHSALIAAPPIKVEAADPPVGEQGTLNLLVRISGRGFDNQSVAEFLVSGTENPGGVLVNNTQFVDSSTLIADISIDDTAELNSFDIQVLSNGRRGKGIDLFTVVEKGSQGRPTQEYPGEYLFPYDSAYLDANGDLIAPMLTGDGSQIVTVPSSAGSYDASFYEDQGELYPDVSVIFMGSGNPKMTLGDPERTLIVQFDDMPDSPGSCQVAGETFYASGDGLWFSQLANQPDWRDPSSPDGIDSNYQEIDGRFLGMTDTDIGYSMMILRFIHPDASGTDFLWRAVFGDYPGATNPAPEKTRVIVEVTDWDSSGNPVAWRIQGLESGFSTARVTRDKLGRGKKESYDLGFCRTFIDYDIRVLR